MSDTIVGLAFYAVVAFAVLVAVRAVARGEEPRPPRPGASALGLWLVVALPSLAQVVAVPGLYDVLSRDGGRIGDGQVWRLVTSAVVQDGGVVGTVSNLVILAFAIVAATTAWGGVRTWATFWAAVVGSNLLVLGWEPDGGGNSMATLALACAVTANILASPARRWALVPGLGVLTGVVVLAAAGDYHAVACGLGVLLGLLPPWGSREGAGMVSARGRRAPFPERRTRPSG